MGTRSYKHRRKLEKSNKCRACEILLSSPFALNCQLTRCPFDTVNDQKKLNRNHRYYIKHCDAVKASGREYYRTNKERLLADPERRKRRQESGCKYSKTDRGKILHNLRERRRRQRRREARKLMKEPWRKETCEPCTNNDHDGCDEAVTLAQDSKYKPDQNLIYACCECKARNHGRMLPWQLREAGLLNETKQIEYQNNGQGPGTDQSSNESDRET